MPWPENIQKSEKIVVFPLRYRQQVTGALLIGCPGECNCITRDLDVIELILQQTGGAICRAAQRELEILSLKGRVEVESGFDELVGREKAVQVRNWWPVPFIGPVTAFLNLL